MKQAEKSAATSGCFDQFVIQDQSLVVCWINLNFIIGFHLIVREMCLNLARQFFGFLRIAFWYHFISKSANYEKWTIRFLALLISAFVASLISIYCADSSVFQRTNYSLAYLLPSWNKNHQKVRLIKKWQDVVKRFMRTLSRHTHRQAEKSTMKLPLC